MNKFYKVLLVILFITVLFEGIVIFRQKSELNAFEAATVAVVNEQARSIEANTAAIHALIAIDQLQIDAYNKQHQRQSW